MLRINKLLLNIKYGKKVAILPNGNEWYRKVKLMGKNKYMVTTNTVYNPKNKRVQKTIEKFSDTNQTFWKDAKGNYTDEFVHPNSRTNIHLNFVDRIHYNTELFNVDNKEIYVVRQIKTFKDKLLSVTKKVIDNNSPNFEKFKNFMCR